MKKIFMKIMILALFAASFIAGTNYAWGGELNTGLVYLDEDPNVPTPETWINCPAVYLSEDPNAPENEDPNAIEPE
jgi:hypothetical protein